MRGIRFTTEQFIARAKELHGDKYDYSCVVYRNNYTKVDIVCNQHGQFEQQPAEHIKGYGCYKCGRENQKTTVDAFIARANNKHHTKYDYMNVVYVDAHTKVQIQCKEHGAFFITPSNHLKGTGCKQCYIQNMRDTTQTFIHKAQQVHGTKYDYTKTEYISRTQQVTIICYNHGSFKQIANDHLFGHGCYKCFQSMSKKELDWLSNISVTENINILSQYKIPGTPYIADGFCEQTNTVYEFYGDAWHGNINKYDPQDTCHPTNKNVTTIELFNKTISREQKIKSKGFNIVSIWEHDYDNHRRAI